MLNSKSLFLQNFPEFSLVGVTFAYGNRKLDRSLIISLSICATKRLSGCLRQSKKEPDY